MFPYIHAAHRSVGSAADSLQQAIDHLDECRPANAQERSRLADVRQRLEVLLGETALALHYAGLLVPGKVERAARAQ